LKVETCENSEIDAVSGRVVSGKRVTRLLVVFVGSRVTTRLIIGSGSCDTRLCSRVSRVDTNPTREPELPTLTISQL